MKKEVSVSPLSANGFSSYIEFYDINRDRIPDVYGLITAPENVHDQTPYTDSASWLMIADPTNMEFLFPPIRFETGITSSIQPIPIKSADEIKLFCISSFIDQKTKDKKYEFYIINHKGQTEQKQEFINDTYRVCSLSQSRKNIYFYTDKDIFEADEQLNIKHLATIKAPIVLGKENIKLDLDGNGDSEYLILGYDHLRNKQLYIFSENFKRNTKYILGQNLNYIKWNHSIITYKEKKEKEVALQLGNRLYIISYTNSPYFYLKYPIYLGVYLLLYLFFWSLLKVQRKRITKYYETEKQLMQQQIALSKKQMEPHFMLNMINNIGYMFTKEDKQNAMYYLGKFGSIMRRGLINSSASQITLEEELEFVEDYLILQKKLMDDELEFTIKRDEKIEEELIQIPHSIVYTFVENAIKHGLRPKENDRKLEVQVKQENEWVKITIQDNGIGRQRSKEIGTTDTGKGMEIAKTIIKGYNQLYGEKISYEVEDLNEENGIVVGTRVDVWI